MAFNKYALKIGRGNFNCDASSFNSAIHNYTTPDVFSVIKSAGYFPDYLGYDEASVKIGDILQVNSFSTGNAIQNELSFNFAILGVSPIKLVQLDQLLYNSYTVPYSGAASGVLTIAFSRDFSGIVNMQIITTGSFNVTIGSIITCTLTVPSVYLPDPTTYGGSGVTKIVPTVNTSTLALINIDININANANAGVVFRQSPGLPFANTPYNLAVRNYYVPYVGAPI